MNVTIIFVIDKIELNNLLYNISNKMIIIPQISITSMPGRENVIKASVNAYLDIDCVQTIETSMINDKVSTYFIIFKDVDDKYAQKIKKFTTDLSDYIIIPHTTYKFVACPQFYLV